MAIDPDALRAILAGAGDGADIAKLLGALSGLPGAEAIARLVCDGYLAVADGDHLRHGPDASRLLFVPDLKPGPSLAHPIMRTSELAVDYGVILVGLGVTDLVSRLYRFGSEPVSPSWRARLHDAEAIADWLGVATVEGERWDIVAPEPVGPAATDPWRRWRRRGSPTASRDKVYVSPTLAAMPDTFRRVAKLAGEAGAIGFKVGRRLPDILRPDRIVVYADSPDSRRQLAHALAAELADLEGHGVPFTSPIDGRAMVSVGQDPFPDSIAARSGMLSWRLYVASVLAEALPQAARARSRRARSRYLQGRLGLDGIDTRTWGWAAHG